MNMPMLCFVLDLRSLSPPLLRDIKQALLQLANYYAVSAQPLIDEIGSKSKPLLDRIGLCYVYRNRISFTEELKIAYNPHGSFNLRDLHHAVNNLPTDIFSPESNGVGPLPKAELKLADILSDKIIYTLGVYDERVPRKVILLSSSLADNLDSATVKALTDASDKGVSFEFCFFEQPSMQLPDINDSISQFVKQIGSARNCSYQICFPDLQVLSGLAKRWFQELKDDAAEILQAHFLFKINLISNLNKISCSLSASFNAIGDDFVFCQTCRCHGIPLDYSDHHIKRYSCPVNGDELEALDIIENSFKVGRQTILYMPSFHGSPKLHKVSTPVDFNIVQRTSLRSLDEGLITGASYFVMPMVQNSDDNNPSQLNNQLFQVMCSTLNSLEQGLICYSYCNIETAKVTLFRCYYVLIPSDKGLMIIKRLSALEEFLPIPNISHYDNSIIDEETENTVKASLLKMELNDYNPVHHERGFHQKLNLLVKESLHFGAIHPKSKEGISEADPITKSPSSEIQPSTSATDDAVTTTRDEITKADIAEEWEQLLTIPELGSSMNSPTICIASPKLDLQAVATSPSQGSISRQVEEKTSRILERLEVPKQFKRKAFSPTISSSVVADTSALLKKKPLIPFGPSADQGVMLTQPLKPNFQKIKRKR